MQGSALPRAVSTEFPGSSTQVDEVPRKYWNEIRGLSHCRQYSHRAEAAALEIDVRAARTAP